MYNVAAISIIHSIDTLCEEFTVGKPEGEHLKRIKDRAKKILFLSDLSLQTGSECLTWREVELLFECRMKGIDVKYMGGKSIQCDDVEIKLDAEAHMVSHIAQRVNQLNK